MEFVILVLLILLAAVVIAWLKDINTIIFLMADQKRKKAFIQELLNENKELKCHVDADFFNRGFNQRKNSPPDKK